MACLSASPSGRRLSELLEEKQEPFLLDIHLLEKGCVLDGYDTALCWPSTGNDAAAVLRRLTSSNKNKGTGKSNKKQHRQPGGLLKLLLSKILHGKASAGAGRKPAALQFSDSFKMAAAVAPAPPCDDAVKTGEVMEKKETECYSDSESGSYSDEDDEKQHSPVSVLEPHPFESSPPAQYGKLSPSRKNAAAAMDVFRELLDAASYSPALLTHLLAKSDDLVDKDTAAAGAEEDDVDDYYYYGCHRTSPKHGRYDDAAYWETHKADLAKVSELVAAEVPSARLDSTAAAVMLPEREDVGAGVADAVLEALLQELVADLGCC